MNDGSQVLFQDILKIVTVAFHICAIHTAFNDLVPAIHQKVIHTQKNLQLKAAALLKYAWPFSRH